MHKNKIILVANTAWNLWNYRLSLIKRLEKSGYNIVLAAPDDRFRQRLEQQTNARFVPLKRLSRSSLSPVQNLICWRELFRLLRAERPALALFFTIKPNILGNLAAALSNTPAIAVVEGLGYSGSIASRWRWLVAPLYRIALRKAGFAIFLNEEDRQVFLRLKLVTPRQARMIHGPGVDTGYFRPVGEPESGLFTFLFSGRLLREKGVETFVEAARRVRKVFPDARFQILGAPDPGNPTSLPLETVLAWQQEGVTAYLGNRDDVRPALTEATALVLPSYYREGVPRSVLEAMAMGKIILTTDTAGCRDTVQSGQNGYLVPPGNADALAQAMIRILQHTPAERKAMGNCSLHLAHTIFSDEAVLPQYLELIEKIASLPSADDNLRPPSQL